MTERFVFNWDVVDGLFPADMVSDMFDAYRALLERLAANPESWRRPVGPLLPHASFPYVKP